MVSAKQYVVAHNGQNHPTEFDREGIDDEFHSNVDCTADDVNDACFRKAVGQFGVKKAHEVGVEPFIATDEFVAKAEARHDSILLSKNMAQKEPEKKIPSTAANAVIHLAKLALVELHHLRAQLALH